VRPITAALVVFAFLPAQPVVAERGPTSPFLTLTPEAQRTFAALNRQRQVVLRERARFIERIAAGDFTGKHVLLRNERVTAFLDVTDPRSASPVREYHKELLAIPVERRAHILVVPNQKREHISRTLDSKIRLDDLEVSAAVLKEAEALAKRLGIRHANVFFNPSDQLSVGYLHAHIMGERDPVPYPAPVAAN
jgi:hypothetical protein